MGWSCLHSRPSARQGMPMAALRIVQPNPIQSVPWHGPYKSRTGILALISALTGERVDAPIFAGRSASTLTTRHLVTNACG